MRSILRLGLTAATATILLTPALGSADSAGATGRVAKVNINGSGSDDYAKFRGSVEIRGGGAATTYKWGGSHCAGLDLSDAQVDKLYSAFYTRRYTKIAPRFKNGQGGKCLVGFQLTGKIKDGPS